MVETSHSRLAPAAAWLAAAVCAAGALHGKWLNFPLSKELRGANYGLGAYAPGATHATLFSFGCVAAVLMVLGALAFQARRWRVLGWVGALLLWLALFGGLKATLTDARLLQALEMEATQQQSAGTYAQQALPVNFGSEPSIWARLDLSTVEDRWIAAWYFVHSGWWAAVGAGALALGYGAARDRRGHAAAITGLGAAAIALACSAGPLLGEWTLMRAHAAEARGDAGAAAREYERAMRYDGRLRLSIDLYAALGCLDAQNGNTGTAEYHVYDAELPSTQMDLPAALAELRTARLMTTNAVLAGVIRKRECELYTQYARVLHAANAYGAAATAAQSALELDHASLLAAFYLSRDYFMTGRYQDAVALSEQVLARTDDPTFRANLLGNMGDAYTKLGQFAEAKVAYRESYKLDYVLNLRGLAALNGPAEDTP